MGIRMVRGGTAAAVAFAAILSMSGCTAPASELRSYLEKAVLELDAGYYATTEAWAEARAQALRNADSYETMAEVQAEVARLATIAGGTHSRFLTAEQVGAAGSTVVAGFKMPSVSVSDGIGTITIPAFGSFEPEADDLYIESAASAISEHAAAVTCGWIVDVRGNTGGDMWVMLTALSPLLDEGVVAQFVDRDGSTEEVIVQGNALYLDDQRVVAMADELRLPRTPVAVLHDRQTASAGEGVVVAFRGQARTHSFGQQTAGMSSANSAITLDDGSMIILTTSLFVDRVGQVYGVPIQPDTRTSLNNSNQNRLTPVDWLHTECAAT